MCPVGCFLPGYVMSKNSVFSFSSISLDSSVLRVSSMAEMIACFTLFPAGPTTFFCSGGRSFNVPMISPRPLLRPRYLTSISLSWFKSVAFLICSSASFSIF